jgi:hypothetical protein
MTRLTVLIVTCFTVVSASFAGDLPSIPQSQKDKDYHFSSETNLPTETKAAIEAAAVVMTTTNSVPDPTKRGWIYRVTKTEKGDEKEFRVLCLRYVTDDKGTMTFIPGGHCVVILDEKFKLKRAMPGA